MKISKEQIKQLCKDPKMYVEIPCPKCGDNVPKLELIGDTNCCLCRTLGFK